MSEKLFNENKNPPMFEGLTTVVGSNYTNTEQIRSFLNSEVGETAQEWKYYGKKNEWVLKTFLKKRNLFFIGIYYGFFRITFVFVDKAVSVIEKSKYRKIQSINY